MLLTPCSSFKNVAKTSRSKSPSPLKRFQRRLISGRAWRVLTKILKSEKSR